MLLLTCCYINVRLLYTSEVFFLGGTVKNIQHVVQVPIREYTYVVYVRPDTVSVCRVFIHFRVSRHSVEPTVRNLSHPRRACRGHLYRTPAGPSEDRAAAASPLGRQSASGYRQPTHGGTLGRFGTKTLVYHFTRVTMAVSTVFYFYIFFSFCSSYCKRSMYTSIGIHAHAHVHCRVYYTRMCGVHVC